MSDKKDEALKLALEYIIAITKSSEMWLIPASRLNKTVFALREALAEQPAQPSKPLTDEEIKRRKPISADFVSFRAGVRCMEREYGSGAKR